VKTRTFAACPRYSVAEKGNTMLCEKCDGIGWFSAIGQRCNQCLGYGIICEDCHRPISDEARKDGVGCTCDEEEEEPC
jgi:hypothetical protein